MTEFPSRQSIRESFVSQSQLAQLHRWIALQFDDKHAPSTLAHPSSLYKLNGEACKLIDLTNAIRSHTINRLTVSDKTYSNPIANHARIESLPTTIELAFNRTNSLEPVIELVNLKLGSSSRDENVLTEVPHRLLALKHRWHALVESPNKFPSAFTEIIAADFTMDWGYGGVTGYDELSAWISGSASSVSAARHDISEFRWHRTDHRKYEAYFVFDWYGYTHDEKPMQARSEHTWQVVDVPAESFPRLSHMQVKFTTPFHLVTGEAT